MDISYRDMERACSHAVLSSGDLGKSAAQTGARLPPSGLRLSTFFVARSARFASGGVCEGVYNHIGEVKKGRQTASMRAFFRE